MKKKRENQECQHRDHRDDQQHSQDDDPQIDPPIHTLTGSGGDVLEHIAGLEREKKERRVVIHRANVVGVVAGKSNGIVRCDQLLKYLRGLREKLQAGVLRIRIQPDKVRVRGNMSSNSRILLRRKCGFFGQNQHRAAVFIEAAVGDDHKVVVRIGNAQLMQRLNSLRYHAQGFTRTLKLPARDGDHAIGLQMVKVFAKSFEGIKIVLAQSKCAGSGGSPCINESHLYYVIAVVRATNIRAAILHVDVDLGQIVQVIRVVGVSATHHVIDDNGIDLNASDVGTAVGDGSHHVHASARANNGEVSLRAQHIRERR